MKSGATASDAEIDREFTGRREGVLEAANSATGRSYAASIQETEAWSWRESWVWLSSTR